MQLSDLIKLFFRASLARIIHEADIVCHNINGRQNLWVSYPKHRVLKPEAQAKESASSPRLRVGLESSGLAAGKLELPPIRSFY